MSGLVVNLAFVGKKPTGLATYANNLVPELKLPQTTLLASQSFLARLPEAGHRYREVPDNLTYEQGKLGHLRRLIWTQIKLPPLCAEADLLFSPVPEAPLGLRCASVVMVHDLIPLRFPRFTSPLTQYFRLYVPQVLRQASQIICNSQATAQDLVDFYQVPVTKITPIPLAHDANHFRMLPNGSEFSQPPKSPINGGLSEPFGETGDIKRPYFLYVGRHDPYKNLARLIQAFAAVTGDYELWIAGATDPRFTPNLQAEVAELNLTHRVKFLDYVTYAQLPVLLNQALAMVYPSLWEGFGFPVLEAMACGTPVITSNRSSLPEVAGDAAILIDPFSPPAITAAMQQVADDSTTQTQLQAAGLARAAQFSWAKTAAATRQVLQAYL
jgi:glycosyltransferase involved in cell wall biosynthesis